MLLRDICRLLHHADLVKIKIAPAEHLLAAFRVLDPEGKGYIRKDVMNTLLTTKGIPLRTREKNMFENFALDKSGRFVYYEDYVHKLIQENENH